LVTGCSNTIKLWLLSAAKSRSIAGRRQRYLSFLCSSVFITIFLISCENDKKAVEALTKNVTLREEAINVQTLFSQNGKMKANLTAPLMIKVPASDSPYVEFPKTLHVDFYNDSLIVETFLDCKYAKYFETLNKVYLRDSVVVITMQGDTLKTPDLWWDQTQKIFYTDKYAEYYSSTKTIYGGKGLRATQDLRSVQFKYPTGTIKSSGSGFPQ
jgi:LPS export ABC transporter protein LptC